MDNIAEILRKMIQACPVRNQAYITMLSDRPEKIALTWRWEVKGKSLYRSYEYYLSSIIEDEILQDIERVKDMDWSKL